MSSVVVYNLFKNYYPLEKKKKSPKVSYSHTELTELM